MTNSKKKIKLFFEDTIIDDPKLNSSKSFFLETIISHLNEKYEISENRGKVLFDFDKGKKLVFTNEIDYVEKNGEIKQKLVNPIEIFPVEDTFRKNINSSWNLSPILEPDEIPFFVIDTDGINISNITQLLGFGDKNTFSFDPRVLVHGKPYLLSSLLSSSYKFQSHFQNWGLVLVNPNFEAIDYSSLKIDDNNIENYLFSDLYKSPIGFSWLFKGNKKKKSFYNVKHIDPLFPKSGNYTKVAKIIWSNNPEIKENFRTSISMDISKFNEQLLPAMDAIDTRLKSHKLEVEQNALSTLIAMYLRKVHNKIDNKIVNKKSVRNKDNLEIQFFEFGANN